MNHDDAIAAFYEAHPYPPPVDDLDAYRERWSDDARRKAEFHRHFPRRAFTGDLDILVAGCGTSQAARHAIRWPNARITGIDVSETSLNETDKLKQRYILDNLSLRDLPIEQVADLGQTFDLIICTGVLHHLTDPDVGLGALSGVLKTDGALNLMVYGRYGRTGVSMMQEYGRLLRLEPTIEEIDALGSTLREIPIGHPLSPMIRNTPDFRTAGALADALLNPRERVYSVPELLDTLDQQGLSFGRWFRQAPYRPQCGAPATTPHARRLAELDERDQYSAMELLRGSMSRHTVIAHHQNTDRRSPTIGQMEHTVPMRLPTAITVEDRLPPGAAAVLINSAHSYTDLVMAITPDEKELVDQIDGVRTLGDIASGIGGGWMAASRTVQPFFERLWWWDQIVFDHSAN
ncbi:MAG: class I SAM-dependent methyltransferase [Acidimicrobiia bacterium]